MLLKWCHLIFLWSDKICRTILPALDSICLPHRIINIHAKCDSHEVNLFICCRFEFRLLHVMSRFDVGHLLYRQLMLKYNNRTTREKNELRSCIHANAIVDKMSPIEMSTHRYDSHHVKWFTAECFVKKKLFRCQFSIIICISTRIGCFGYEYNATLK